VNVFARPPIRYRAFAAKAIAVVPDMF